MLTREQSDAIADAILTAGQNPPVQTVAEWFRANAKQVSRDMRISEVAVVLSDLCEFSSFSAKNETDAGARAATLAEAQRDSALWACEAIRSAASEESDEHVEAVLLKEEGDGVLLLFKGHNPTRVASAALWSAAWLCYCSEVVAGRFRDGGSADVPTARAAAGLVRWPFAIELIRNPIENDVYHKRQPLARHDLLSRWLNSLYRVLGMAERGQILLDNPHQVEDNLLDRAGIAEGGLLRPPITDGDSFGFYLARGPDFTFYKLKGAAESRDNRHLGAIELGISLSSLPEANARLKKAFRAGFRAWCRLEFGRDEDRSRWLSAGGHLYAENLRLVLEAKRVIKPRGAWKPVTLYWARILAASAEDYVDFLNERVLSHDATSVRSTTVPTSPHNRRNENPSLPKQVGLALLRVRGKRGFDKALEALRRSEGEGRVLCWDGLYGQWDLAAVVEHHADGGSFSLPDQEPWSGIRDHLEDWEYYDCRPVHAALGEREKRLAASDALLPELGAFETPP